MGIEVLMEDWQEAIGNTDEIIMALEKLTGGDIAIMTLVYAYGKECRKEEKAIRMAGFKSDDEMAACCLSKLMKDNKLRLVKEV